MKAYMLAELAFYLQGIIVIHIEERRKDHWQMFIHHIVTCTLIYASYRYGHTRVGNLILVLMDVSDLILPVRGILSRVCLLCLLTPTLQIAKCLKYLRYNTLCDLMFGLFMISWFVARHVLYLMVCYSVWAHTPEIMPHGCFKGAKTNVTGPFEPPTDQGPLYLLEPLWDPEGLVCYNESVKWTFLSMLLFLEALTIIWFSMIIRVAIRVVSGAGADDTRSDDEGDAVEDEDEYTYEVAQPLEEEVGVDKIDLKNWERRTGVKRTEPTTTGVSFPGHSDRKELLGRIGCEKHVD
jgi:acyl-CoA-dependent ceramide synthase